jgi:hypothetical protein
MNIPPARVIRATAASLTSRRKTNRPHETHEPSRRIVLSERDTELVIDLLANPPEPTKAFVDVAKRYKNR